MKSGLESQIRLQGLVYLEFREGARAKHTTRDDTHKRRRADKLISHTEWGESVSRKNKS